MHRIARGLVHGYIYHMINRGNGMYEVFHKEPQCDISINEGFDSLKEPAVPGDTSTE
jgi:hypothetical protein